MRRDTKQSSRPSLDLRMIWRAAITAGKEWGRYKLKQEYQEMFESYSKEPKPYKEEDEVHVNILDPSQFF